MFIITILCIFVHFPPFQPLPYWSILRFPVLTKRILVSRLSCFRWRTLISSLFTSPLFIDSEIVFAYLPRPFPLAWVKMNFPLYYPLFPLHGHFCRFQSVCLLLCNVHSSFCLQAFIHRCFHAFLFAIRYVSALL